MSKKVLHVDDMESWRNVVSSTLTKNGHSVDSHSHLADAKKAAASGGYDAYVVDGSVDGKNDGLAWAQELKQSGKRVVVLSGTPPRDMDSVDKGDFDGDKLRKLVS